MEVIRVNPQAPAPEAFEAACQHLRKGRTVAYPTETFYGLGADAANEAAVREVYAIKGRPLSLPMSVLISGEEMLAHLAAEVPEAARALMGRYWPGPLTIVFAAQDEVPALLTAGTGRLGIRCSSHPVAQTLVAHYGAPITATSANLSGRADLLQPAQIAKLLPGVSMILDAGPARSRSGSTVIDVNYDPPRILREGVISAESILRFLASARQA